VFAPVLKLYLRGMSRKLSGDSRGRRRIAAAASVFGEVKTLSRQTAPEAIEHYAAAAAAENPLRRNDASVREGAVLAADFRIS
jgi:hypothetical protein